MGVSPLSLTLNILVEMAVFVLAVMLARTRPRHNPNRGFLFFLFILLLWMPTMLVKGYLLARAPHLLYLVYRWSLSIGALGLVSFALFTLSLQRGGPPPRRLALALGLHSLALFCIGLFSPWVIRDAWPEKGTVHVASGPFYPLMIASLALFCAVSLRALGGAVRASSGYAKVRNLNYLLGFLLFTLPVAVSGVIYHLEGELDPTGTSFYALSMLPPMAIFAYAVLRYRQLDIRLAATRVTAYLLTVLTFGLPSVAVAMILQALGEKTAVRYASYLAMLALTVLLAPPVLEAAERVSSRLFLMGLYDPQALLARASTLLFSSRDLEDGVKRSAAVLAKALGLQELRLALHPSLTGPYAGRSLGTKMDLEGLARPLDEPNPALRFLAGWSGPLFPADSHTAKEGKEWSCTGEDALREMREAGYEAALPVVGGGGLLGMLLAGGKKEKGGPFKARRAGTARGLTPLDYDTLEGFASILAPFVENGLISTYLQERVEELTSIESRMQKEEERRSALANSAYRSLLGPLARMRSSVDLLGDRGLLRDEERRRQALDGVLEAAEELNRRISQAVGQAIEPWEGLPGTTVGEAGADLEPFDLETALRETKALFSPNCAERIKASADGGALLYRDRLRFREGLALLAEFCLRETGEGGEVFLECAAAGGILRMRMWCRAGKGNRAPCLRAFSPLSLLIQEQAERGEERAIAARAASSLLDAEVRPFGEDGGSWGFCLDLPLAKKTGVAVP